MQTTFFKIVSRPVDFEKDRRKPHAFLGMGTRPKKPGGEDKPGEDQGREGEEREGAEDAQEVDEPATSEPGGTEPGSTEPGGTEPEGRRSSRETPLPPLDKVSPRHVAYVRGLLSKFGVSPSYEYEDLVQEVLIQAARSLDSPLEPRALLFGITRHLVFRWLAKRDNERMAVQTHLDDVDPEGQAPDVEAQWRGAERAHAVHQAIRDLPDIFREVFVRCEIDEVPMPDVARELGIPINTGYTRLHLARARFQEAFKRYMARKRIGKDDLAIPIALGALVDASEVPVAKVLPIKPSGAPSVPATATPSPADGALRAPDALTPPRLGAFARWHLLAANAILVAGAVSALWTAPFPSRPSPSSEPTAVPEPPRASADPVVAPVQSGSQEAPPRSDDDVVKIPASPEDSLEPNGDVRTVRLPPANTSARAEGTWARQIVGLARAGKRADASVQAAAFQRIYPRSTYRAQIEAALRDASKSGPP